MSETLAVGDGSNDLLMLKEAGLGLAWRAKAKVQMAAPQRLNGKDMGDLLCLLGEPYIRTACDAQCNIEQREGLAQPVEL